MILESHGTSYDEQMDYHREFMRSQDIASNFAEKFNEWMSQSQTHFTKESQRTPSNLPRIKFIVPTVVELNENGAEKNMLVEEFLEGDYKKFNSNMGYVEDDVKQLVERMNSLGLGGNFSQPVGNGIGAIEEENTKIHWWTEITTSQHIKTPLQPQLTAPTHINHQHRVTRPLRSSLTIVQ